MKELRFSKGNIDYLVRFSSPNGKLGNVRLITAEPLDNGALYSLELSAEVDHFGKISNLTGEESLTLDDEVVSNRRLNRGDLCGNKRFKDEFRIFEHASTLAYWTATKRDYSVPTPFPYRMHVKESLPWPGLPFVFTLKVG